MLLGRRVIGGVECLYTIFLNLVSSPQIDLLGITVLRYGVFLTDICGYSWLNSDGRRKGPHKTNSLLKELLLWAT